MIFKVEIGIDVDDKRQIWITGSAQTEQSENPAALAEAVIPKLVEEVTAQGLAAHERAVAQSVISGLPRGGDGRAPSERPKRPEDPPTMRAMQED